MGKPEANQSRATLGMPVPYNGGDTPCIFTFMWKSLLYNLGKTTLLSF